MATIKMKIKKDASSVVQPLFLQIYRMWGEMQIVVFHSFAYTRCTAFFQPFCEISTIRYNMLNNRVFPHRSTERLMNIKVVFFFEFL